MLFGEQYKNKCGEIYIENFVTGEDAFAVFFAE